MMRRPRCALALFLALAMLLSAALSEEQIEILTESAPAAEAVEQPSVEEPAPQPEAGPEQAPAEEPTVEPAEEPADGPAQAHAEEPTVEPAEEPTVEPAEEPAGEPAQGDTDVALTPDQSADKNVIPDQTDGGELSEISFIDVENGGSIPTSNYALRWTAVPEATEYHLTLKCNGITASPICDTNEISTDLFRDHNWTRPDQEIYITVRACKYSAEDFEHIYLATGSIMLHPAAATYPVEPSNVTLTPEKVTLTVGQMLQFTCVVEPAEADPSVTYRSDDEKVAYIYDDGMMFALAEGSATITAETSNGKTAACEVTVTQTELIVPEDLTLGKGEKYALAPEISDGSSAAFSFESSDPKIVKVSKKGKLTALKTGTAAIVVAADNGLWNSCIVTVLKAPGKVKLGPTRTTLGVGETLEFVAVLPKGSASKLTASSSKAAIASVSEGGAGRFIVTARKAGTATIAVKTFNGMSAKFTLTVKRAPTEGKLTIIPAEKTLALRQNVTLKAKYAKNFGGSYSWSIMEGEDGRAMVSDSGVVKATGVGSVTVIATSYNGVTAKCRLTIEPEPEEVRLPDTELTLGKGEKFTLSPTAMAGDTAVTAATFTYASDDKSVAAVNKTSGKITAKRTGTATIEVESYNGKRAMCAVTVVKAPSQVTLSSTRATLSVGESAEFTATLPEGSASRLTTSATRASVATITQTEPGKFTIEAQNRGKTTITVKTFNGKTAKFTLTVE